MAKRDANPLGKFAQRKTSRPARSIAPTKAAGEVVAVTARFSREDWNRLSDYARKSRISLQALIEHGCSRILEDDGLKPFAAMVARHRDAKAA